MNSFVSTVIKYINTFVCLSFKMRRNLNRLENGIWLKRPAVFRRQEVHVEVFVLLWFKMRRNWKLTWFQLKCDFLEQFGGNFSCFSRVKLQESQEISLDGKHRMNVLDLWSVCDRRQTDSVCVCVCGHSYTILLFNHSLFVFFLLIRFPPPLLLHTSPSINPYFLLLCPFFNVFPGSRSSFFTLLPSVPPPPPPPPDFLHVHSVSVFSLLFLLHHNKRLDQVTSVLALLCLIMQDQFILNNRNRLLSSTPEPNL